MALEPGDWADASWKEMIRSFDGSSKVLEPVDSAVASWIQIIWLEIAEE